MEQRPLDGGERERALRGQRFVFGPWIFNVDRGLAIVAEQVREPQSLPVAPWAHFYGLDATESDESFPLFGPRNLDRDYAMTTDLAEPVLVAMLHGNSGEEFPLLIDGTHRLYRAHAEHVAELPAYVLTAEETLAIRDDGFIGASVHWLSHDERRLPGGPPEAGDGGG